MTKITYTNLGKDKGLEYNSSTQGSFCDVTSTQGSYVFNSTQGSCDLSVNHPSTTRSTCSTVGSRDLTTVTPQKDLSQLEFNTEDDLILRLSILYPTFSNLCQFWPKIGQFYCKTHGFLYPNTDTIGNHLRKTHRIKCSNAQLLNYMVTALSCTVRKKSLWIDEGNFNA